MISKSWAEFFNDTWKKIKTTYAWKLAVRKKRYCNPVCSEPEPHKIAYIFKFHTIKTKRKESEPKYIYCWLQLDYAFTVHLSNFFNAKNQFSVCCIAGLPAQRRIPASRALRMLLAAEHPRTRSYSASWFSSHRPRSFGPFLSCNIPKMRNLVNCAQLSCISMDPTWIPKYTAAAVAFLAGQPPPLLSSPML
jgi:hypothetical protein